MLAAFTFSKTLKNLTTNEPKARSKGPIKRRCQTNFTRNETLEIGYGKDIQQAIKLENVHLSKYRSPAR
jgi:hypothetical protein